MYFFLSPRDWFFIFIALVLSCYIRLASAKTQVSLARFPASAAAQIFKM